MDNVFIGSGTRILYNTRIGSNVIVGSDSLVSKDIPDNSVYAGVPARFICSFDEHLEKHRICLEHFMEKYKRRKVCEIDDPFAAVIYYDFRRQKEKVTL